MIIGLVLALTGILFKILILEGAGLILTLSLMTLSMVAFVQFFIALIQIQNNKMLKVLAALISYAFSISFTGILFRFQFWSGASLMMLVSTISLLILSIIFIINWNKLVTEENKMLIRRNLFIPGSFIVFFTLLHYAMPNKLFFNTFSTQRENKTYEQFQSEMNNTEIPDATQTEIND